jgi:hypothetical protein
MMDIGKVSYTGQYLIYIRTDQTSGVIKAHIIKTIHSQVIVERAFSIVAILPCVAKVS